MIEPVLIAVDAIALLTDAMVKVFGDTTISLTVPNIIWLEALMIELC